MIAAPEDSDSLIGMVDHPTSSDPNPTTKSGRRALKRKELSDATDVVMVSIDRSVKLNSHLVGRMGAAFDGHDDPLIPSVCCMVLAGETSKQNQAAVGVDSRASNACCVGSMLLDVYTVVEQRVGLPAGLLTQSENWWLNSHHLTQRVFRLLGKDTAKPSKSYTVPFDHAVDLWSTGFLRHRNSRPSGVVARQVSACHAGTRSVRAAGLDHDKGVKKHACTVGKKSNDVRALPAPDAIVLTLDLALRHPTLSHVAKLPGRVGPYQLVADTAVSIRRLRIELEAHLSSSPDDNSHSVWRGCADKERIAKLRNYRGSDERKEAERTHVEARRSEVRREDKKRAAPNHAAMAFKRICDDKEIEANNIECGARLNEAVRATAEALRRMEVGLEEVAACTDLPPMVRAELAVDVLATVAWLRVGDASTGVLLTGERFDELQRIAMGDAGPSSSSTFDSGPSPYRLVASEAMARGVARSVIADRVPEGIGAAVEWARAPPGPIADAAHQRAHALARALCDAVPSETELASPPDNTSPDTLAITNPLAQDVPHTALFKSAHVGTRLAFAAGVAYQVVKDGIPVAPVDEHTPIRGGVGIAVKVEGEPICTTGHCFAGFREGGAVTVERGNETTVFANPRPGMYTSVVPISPGLFQPQQTELGIIGLPQPVLCAGTRVYINPLPTWLSESLRTTSGEVPPDGEAVIHAVEPKVGGDVTLSVSDGGDLVVRNPAVGLIDAPHPTMCKTPPVPPVPSSDADSSTEPRAKKARAPPKRVDGVGTTITCYKSSSTFYVAGTKGKHGACVAGPEALPLPEFQGRIQRVDPVAGGAIVLKRTMGVTNGALKRMELGAMLVRDPTCQLEDPSYHEVLREIVRVYTEVVG